MKMMIDISEELLNHILDSKETIAEVNELVTRVVNGKVFPTNTTNGDMIQDIFPNCVVKEYEKSVDVIKLDGLSVFSAIWWNAPYGGDA